jgi:hypothetical protein
VQEQLREVCMVVCMLTVRHRVWLYVCSPWGLGYGCMYA